jgi:signal peptidase I
VKKVGIKEILAEVFETFLVSIIVILIIYSTIASIEVVWGASMEPTFLTGERILVEKLSKHFIPYERGEVVVLIPPTDNKHYIKRIIGMPGDVIRILDCKIYLSLDGRKFVLDEDKYLKPDTCTEPGGALEEGRALKLGDDQYIVLGDNRSASVDSRSFGVIQKKEILGKVIFRFWPLDNVGFIN